MNRRTIGVSKLLPRRPDSRNGVSDEPGVVHDRWTWIVHPWSNPLRKPIGDSESYRDYRAAQREGVVRPIVVRWRDERGVHSLHLPRNRASQG